MGSAKRRFGCKNRRGKRKAGSRKNGLLPQPNYRFVHKNQCGKIFGAVLTHHCKTQYSRCGTFRPRGIENLYVLVGYGCGHRYVFYFQRLCLSDVSGQGLSVLPGHTNQRATVCNFLIGDFSSVFAVSDFSGENMQ